MIFLAFAVLIPIALFQPPKISNREYEAAVMTHILTEIQWHLHNDESVDLSWAKKWAHKWRSSNDRRKPFLFESPVNQAFCKIIVVSELNRVVCIHLPSIDGFMVSADGYAKMTPDELKTFENNNTLERFWFGWSTD